MTSFGYPTGTHGTTQDLAPGPAFRFGSLYQAPSNGLIGSITTYVQGGTGGGTFEGVLYSNPNGTTLTNTSPLLGTTGVATVTASQAAGFVTTFFPTPIPVVAGNWYIPAVAPNLANSGTSGASIILFTDTTSGQPTLHFNHDLSINTGNWPTPDSTWLTATFATDGTSAQTGYSICANYLPTSGRVVVNRAAVTRASNW